MAISFPQALKCQAETALTSSHFDFIAKYHAVADLRRLAHQQTTILDDQTLVALAQLLQTQDVEHVRQSYFLFREAAAVMTAVATAACGNGLGSRALAWLHRLLRSTHGSAHRGVAEALGSLPVTIAAPQVAGRQGRRIPSISWNRLTHESGLDPIAPPRYIGRSLAVEIAPAGRLLVVKMAQPGDSAATLANEIRWMERLRRPEHSTGRRFQIPEPLRPGGHPVFSLDRLPLALPAEFSRHPDRLAIAYLARREYYVYPNSQGVDGPAATEMLGRNAYLLGRLAAAGVVHHAPIPLFHNRTQRLRRVDQGRYQWFRAGRLDQWLDSCAFPNFGLSGLRDFEHLEIFAGGSRCLYRHIGSHFLSLLLVAGSWFRCQDGATTGLDENGQPVDARHLFDRHLLGSMIRDVFTNYFKGFTGSETAVSLPLDLDRLVERMIAEMGVDRHMTELLRRSDQQALSDSQFFAFLAARGFDSAQMNGVVRGEKDILLTSGPHLGDFNRQISLPELIEGVAAMAAVCMAGRYAQQNDRRLPATSCT